MGNTTTTKIDNANMVTRETLALCFSAYEQWLLHADENSIAEVVQIKDKQQLIDVWNEMAEYPLSWWSNLETESRNRLADILIKMINEK